MSQLPATVPTAVANLLVAYFCHTATEEQRLQLDEWICKNDSNMAVFETCLETSLLPVTFDPDRAEELEELQSIHLN